MKSIDIIKSYVNPLFTRDYWQMLGDYVGIGRHRKQEPISDPEALAHHLSSRASHVAQASLYGYLRTRAGTRFPVMFENEDIVKSINIAKWHIWLACLSDLCVFTGQCLLHSDSIDEDRVRELIPAALRRALDEAGVPEEAGPDFADAREQVLQRIDTCDWHKPRDDDTIFSRSPDALYYWAPIADELKERDEAIVRNSIRFRWIEVRRRTRKLLDPDALAQSEAES